MSTQTKIQLSPLEMDLLNNAQWILTKNAIVKKAQQLLEAVQLNIVDYVNAVPGIFPREVIAVSPKISRGENYLGLPWLILDYPRHFDKENIFAIRTMFWWANFFSTTLHLSGVYAAKYRDTIISIYDELAKNQFYICVHTEQWHHHLDEQNYLPVNTLRKDDFSDQIANATFIKLAQKLSLTEWNTAIAQLSEKFIRISHWLR
ncbi:MAG TPA: hypothetical protein VFP87_00305 [Chitinophagaceae bacterium]|nr:hypothetical protein [Chitinophagaceae bacterium]